MERVHILLNLLKAPRPVVRETTQLNLPPAGSSSNVEVLVSPLSSFRPGNRGRGNFEKEGKDTQGIRKHGVSGFIPELVLSLRRSRESGNTAWLFVLNKSFEPWVSISSPEK